MHMYIHVFQARRVQNGGILSFFVVWLAVVGDTLLISPSQSLVAIGNCN